MAKRFFDIFFSIFGLLFLLPIIIFLAIWIKLESFGPVFYRGNRVGLHGKPFNIFKFRTMVANAEKIGGPSTAEDDVRLTKSGKFIRKYKLDEIAQLLNVFVGNMSFVGPRPEVQEYVDLYTDEEKKILELKPGITDYASIKYNNEGEILKGYSDPEKAYLELIRPGKLKLQLKYYEEKSFSTDLKILFQTFKMLVVTRT